MITYEFETELKNGMIEIPEEFKIKQMGKFKVIIVMKIDKQEKLKRALLNAPYWSDEAVDEFQNAIRKGYGN